MPLLPMRSLPMTSDAPISTLDAKKREQVVGLHLTPLVRRDAGHLLVQHGARVRPAGDDVREVAAPDDVVDADLVAQLDADRVVEEAPQGMILYIVARPALQAGDAEVALGPDAVLLVLQVHLLE